MYMYHSIQFSEAQQRTFNNKRADFYRGDNSSIPSSKQIDSKQNQFRKIS